MISEHRQPALRAVVVGGSAGSLEPLLALVSALPAELPAALVVALHIPRRCPNALLDVLAAATALRVEEAEDKAPLAKGTIFVAPPDYHTLLDAGPCLALSVDDPVRFSIPSIDVLFESAARVMGPRAAGLLLSGANEDGARGLLELHRAGASVWVQAPDEASSPEMPRAGKAHCPPAAALSVASLARAVLQHCLF